MTRKELLDLIVGYGEAALGRELSGRKMLLRGGSFGCARLEGELCTLCQHAMPYHIDCEMIVDRGV